MNENRCVFALNGVTGMLIATVLLLSILGVLTYLGIMAQQDAMQKPYSFERGELNSVKMLDTTDTQSKIMRVKE